MAKSKNINKSNFNTFDLLSDIRNFFTVEDIDLDFMDSKQKDSKLAYCYFRLREVKNWLFSIEEVIPCSENGFSTFVIYTQFEPLINKFKLSRSYYKTFVKPYDRKTLDAFEDRCLDTDNYYLFVDFNCAFDICDFIDMVRSIIEHPYVAAYNSDREFESWSYISEKEAKSSVKKSLKNENKKHKRAKVLFNKIMFIVNILKRLGFIEKYYFNKSFQVDDTDFSYESLYYNSDLYILAKDSKLSEFLIEAFVNKYSHNGLVINNIDWTTDKLQHMYNINGMNSEDRKLFEHLVDEENKRLEEVSEFKEEI